MIIDKEKQKEGTVQDKEVLLYKSHDILSSSSDTTSPDIQMLQDKINNQKKALKTLQLPIKTIVLKQHYRLILTAET